MRYWGSSRVRETSFEVAQCDAREAPCLGWGIRHGAWAPWLMLFGLAASAPVLAHDMWLQPTDFTASVGEVVGLRLWIGHGGEAEGFPRRDDHMARFDVSVGDRAWMLPGQPGLEPAGYLRTSTSGLHTVVYESTGSVSELPADQFDAYLVEEGLESIRVWRHEHGEADQPGREQYRRSLKSLVRVGGSRLDARDRAVGLPLEFVLESSLDAGRLRARLLWHGTALAGALVELQPLAGERPDRPPAAVEARSARTNADGWVSWPKIEPGAWMLAAVHMERAVPSHAEWTWRTTFTTLTFALTDSIRRTP